MSDSRLSPRAGETLDLLAEYATLDEAQRVCLGIARRTLGALVDQGLVSVTGPRHFPTWRLTKPGKAERARRDGAR